MVARCPRSCWRGRAVLLAAIAFFLFGSILPSVSLADDAALYRTDIQPFLEEFCYDCHSGEDPDGTARLDQITADVEVNKNFEAWRSVKKMMVAGEMPPEDYDQPSKDDVAKIQAWIDRWMKAADAAVKPQPGHVTLRRLNRIEYENTIRDLLGVRFKATEKFPADEVGYGFDNIGDVLSLSPLLMEKYLDAADEIARQAIVTNQADILPKTRITAGRLSPVVSGKLDGVRVLASHGEVTTDFTVTKPGEYIIRATAFGDQAGDEPAKMELRIDGKAAKTFDVKAVRAEPADYEFRVKATPGKMRVGLAFVNDYYNPQGPPNDRDRNLGIVALTILGPTGITEADYPESHRRLLFVKPGGKITLKDAARPIIQRLASRAFRRPATDAEIDRLLAIGAMASNEGASFEEAAQLVLKAVLVSPHFLFKVEMDPAASGGERLLNEYELATRLSYFLWSSIPDDELLLKAHRGELRRDLESQIKRMLADSKSSALVRNFGLQWLQLRGIEEMTPNRQQFSSFDDELRAAMMTETEMFLTSVLRENRSVLDLIDADYTFVNASLAKHYGLSKVDGDEFQRVSVGNSPRGGVMTMASVLTVTSNPTRTSPVKRGKWVLDNLLGEPPPEPPANVPLLDEGAAAVASASLRERLEQHRADPNCAVCHRKMDPLGFALENFDAVGQWRTKDGKFEVDPSGELPGGQTFKGPAELKQILKQSSRDQFVNCLAEKMLIYALGRGLERFDRPAVAKITDSLAKNDYRFAVLVTEIVRSEPFQKTQREME